MQKLGSSAWTRSRLGGIGTDGRAVVEAFYGALARVLRSEGVAFLVCLVGFSVAAVVHRSLL